MAYLKYLVYRMFVLEYSIQLFYLKQNINFRNTYINLSFAMLYSNFHRLEPACSKVKYMSK